MRQYSKYNSLSENFQMRRTSERIHVQETPVLLFLHVVLTYKLVCQLFDGLSTAYIV